MTFKKTPKIRKKRRKTKKNAGKRRNTPKNEKILTKAPLWRRLGRPLGTFWSLLGALGVLLAALGAPLGHQNRSSNAICCKHVFHKNIEKHMEKQ